MSNHTMIAIRRFCEPCFVLLAEKGIIDPNDYQKIKGESLFDIVTKEMMEATTERRNEAIRNQNGNTHYHREGFFGTVDMIMSWQQGHNNVQADDVAIVVANALIREGCQTKYLQFEGIHFNSPGFGEKGYKALALALSINRTVQRIDFYDVDGLYDLIFGGGPFSYFRDKSNGFMLKALQHNKRSALKSIPTVNPFAFGPATWKAWQRAKPDMDRHIGYHECSNGLAFYDLEEDDDDY